MTDVYWWDPSGVPKRVPWLDEPPPVDYQGIRRGLLPTWKEQRQRECQSVALTGGMGAILITVPPNSKEPVLMGVSQEGVCGYMWPPIAYWHLITVTGTVIPPSSAYAWGLRKHLELYS